MAKTAVNRLTVKTEGNTPYDICLKNSFSSLAQELDGIGCGGRRLCIVSDSNVADLYLKEVTEEAKKCGKEVISFVFPAGEQSKTLATVQQLYETLIQAGFDRKDYLLALGGGVVGVECAALYHCLDCAVTVLEAADHILPFMDKEIAQRLTMILKKRGLDIEAKATVQKIEGEPGNMTVTYVDKKGAEHTVTAQGVLAAAGRKANVDGLFGENFSVEMERGAIVGDVDGRTSVPHVYVIGDAKAKNIQLAHVASAQGENAVAVITGKKPPLDMSVVPSCVYTTPEIASVGLTEENAKANGIAVKSGKYLTGANGKCLIEGTESGYVKLVTDKENGRILGAQLVCPRATDMVGELTLAIQKGLTAADLSEVIHPHPTFSEMLFGAAEGLRPE